MIPGWRKEPDGWRHVRGRGKARTSVLVSLSGRDVTVSCPTEEGDVAGALREAAALVDAMRRGGEDNVPAGWEFNGILDWGEFVLLDDPHPEDGKYKIKIDERDTDETIAWWVKLRRMELEVLEWVQRQRVKAKAGGGG